MLFVKVVLKAWDNQVIQQADNCRSLSGALYPKLSTYFEGARLTQLVQLVTAGRLFLGHKGFLLQVSLRVAAMAQSGRRMDVMQRVLRILACLDLKHNERRRARISRGYKAGELSGPLYPKLSTCLRAPS